MIDKDLPKGQGAVQGLFQTARPTPRQGHLPWIAPSPRALLSPHFSGLTFAPTGFELPDRPERDPKHSLASPNAESPCSSHVPYSRHQPASLPNASISLAITSSYKTLTQGSNLNFLLPFTIQGLSASLRRGSLSSTQPPGSPHQSSGSEAAPSPPLSSSLTQPGPVLKGLQRRRLAQIPASRLQSLVHSFPSTQIQPRASCKSSTPEL